MFKITFFQGEMIFTAAWLAARAAVWIRRGTIDPKRELQLLLMYINLAVILRFTFYPFSRVGGEIQPLIFYSSRLSRPRLNLIPFVKLFDYDSTSDLILNITGNFAMFIPTGIVLPTVYKKLDRFWKVAAAGAGISLCIELLQLPFSVRMTDADDLIVNTLGVAAGYGIYAALRRVKARQGK